MDSYAILHTLTGQNHLLQQLHAVPRYIQDEEWGELERVFRNSFNLTPESLRAAHPGLTKGDLRIYILSHLQLGNIITDGKRTLWIDVGEFSYGCPEWDLCTMWAMAIRMRREVAEQLLHLTPEQRAEHWNIFLSAYLQTKDPQVLEAYVKRLLPFYALKSPYMVDMARHQALPEQVLQFMYSQIPEL